MTNIDDEVVEAIVNEFTDINNLITENVRILRLKAPEGSICLWRFDVNAKSHYLESENDTDPKETNLTTFWLDVKDGYPKSKPLVYYEPNHRLASVNVFRNGVQCIDEWHYDEEYAGNNSSLLMVVEKTIKDIIHEPSVSRFDSMAYVPLADWQKKNIESKAFPTCKLSHVFRIGDNSETAFVPPKLPARPVRNNNTPPALPVR